MIGLRSSARQDDARRIKARWDADASDGVTATWSSEVVTRAEVMAHGELVFEVDGYPPGKNEALSLFNAAHGQAAGARRLLEAARAAIGPRAMPLFREAVGLEVICEAPAERQPWDATNYLGGIADVLEDKSRRQRNALAHLGDLAAICVYVNDRQIKEIRYREIEGPGPRYQVRIWPLDRSL